MLGFSKDDPHGRPSKKMRRGWTFIEVPLCAFAIFMVVLGALIAAFGEGYIDTEFQTKMVLTPTSEGVKEWTSPSVPITSHLYFWNWTNANEIGTIGFKPVLQQVGPYTFSEKHFKVNMTWNENGTVTYRTQKFYYFRPELSSGTLSDNITSVNVIAATLSEMSNNWSKWTQMSLSLALVSQQQKISWTRTVAELTFDGFKNPIQSFGSIFSSTTKDKFGFFYDFNGTISSDVITMSTGAQDIFTLGQVRRFNYANSTTAHTGACSNFYGSLGELWSPQLTQQSVLSLFTPDMCRPIPYFYEGESSHNGISTFVYSSNPKTVDNGSLVADYKCFCHPTGCEPTGLYDLRTCKFGAPVYMSLPHLYLADPVYQNAVIGMQPKPDRHKFFLEMEPRTGIPLKVAARVQLNVKIIKNRGLSTFRQVETVLLPVWWMETVMELPTTHTSQLHMMITIISCIPYISAVVLAIGSVFLLFITFKRYNTCRSHRENNIVRVTDAGSFGLISRTQPSQTTNTDLPSVNPKHEFIPVSDVKMGEVLPLMPANNNGTDNVAAPMSDNIFRTSSQSVASDDILDFRL